MWVENLSKCQENYKTVGFEKILIKFFKNFGNNLSKQGSGNCEEILIKFQKSYDFEKILKKIFPAFQK